MILYCCFTYNHVGYDSYYLGLLTYAFVVLFCFVLFCYVLFCFDLPYSFRIYPSFIVSIDTVQAGRAGRYGETASPSKMDSPRSGGKALGYGVGKGNVLGRGDEGGDGEGGGSGEEGKEGFRQQLHSKWEADKKTQKR